MRLASPRFARVAALVFAVAPVIAACSDDSSSSSSSGSSGGDTACAADTRKDTYAVGLTKSGTTLTVKLLDAVPAPPAKGTNTMTFQVLDATGKPVDGATLSVVPFMPDHGHGSAVVPEVAAGGDGKYTVSRIYLAMAGLWELRVSVQAGGGAAEAVVFKFCLDG